MTIMGFKKGQGPKTKKPVKKKTRKGDIKGSTAGKVWRMALEGIDYKTIGDAVGFQTQAVKAYMDKRVMDEATKLWAKEIKAVGKCEICGKTDNLNAHHLLEKSTWPHLRYDLSNGICLCSDHHQFNPTLSPHANTVSSHNFLQWLQENRKGQYVYFLEHKDDKTFHRISAEEAFRELSK